MKELIIENLNELPTTLRNARKKQKLTRKQMSIHARISLNMIYLTEHGQCIPSMYILTKWAYALGFESIVINTQGVINNVEQNGKFG